MDEGQLALLSYAKFYESLNEIPLSDRPSDEIIEDDEAIDRWYENYLRDMTRKAKGNAKGPAVDFAQIPQFQS